MLKQPDGLASQDHAVERSRWQKEYQVLIRQRLDASCLYIQTHSVPQVSGHLRSFLTLLEEAHRYKALADRILKLITVLNPLPLRMGYGNRWEAELRYALKRTHDPARRMEYLNDLAENALARGEFSQAIRDSRIGLSTSHNLPAHKGNFCRILFNAYQAAGKTHQAKNLITRNIHRFKTTLPARKIPDFDALGWLRFNQCRLKLLREQGKVNEALELAGDMVFLDDHLGNPDPELSAALLVDRSTLLWVKTRFQESVNDLQSAIQLYESIGDHFNAEGLQSNLGLVYWSMGEFDRSETALKGVIAFFQKTGATHLVTYDIGNLGLVYFCQGKLKQAETQLQLHISHAQQIGLQSEEFRGLSNLADLHYYLGEYTRSLEEHAITDVYSRKHGARDGHMISNLWVAMCLYQLGQRTKAIRKIRRVVHWCQTNDVPMLESPACRCLAHFLPVNKRKPYLDRALQLTHQQNRRLEEAGALLQLAEIASSPEEQTRLWKQGAEILSMIGASAWLQGHTPQDPPFIPMMR